MDDPIGAPKRHPPTVRYRFALWPHSLPALNGIDRSYLDRAPIRGASRSAISANAGIMTSSEPAGLIHAAAAPIPAPVTEARPLTTSLSTIGIPRASVVTAPQSWTIRSVARSHTEHRYDAWRVAPSRLSTSDPARPASVTPSSTPPADSPSPDQPSAAPTAASAAISSAPAAAPRVPSVETAPEVPGGAARPDRIDRGGLRLCAPISVAQVSDVTAATAPA